MAPSSHPIFTESIDEYSCTHDEIKQLLKSAQAQVEAGADINDLPIMSYDQFWLLKDHVNSFEYEEESKKVRILGSSKYAIKFLLDFLAASPVTVKCLEFIWNDGHAGKQCSEFLRTLPKYLKEALEKIGTELETVKIEVDPMPDEVVSVLSEFLLTSSACVVSDLNVEMKCSDSAWKMLAEAIGNCTSIRKLYICTDSCKQGGDMNEVVLAEDVKEYMIKMLKTTKSITHVRLCLPLGLVFTALSDIGEQSPIKSLDLHYMQLTTVDNCKLLAKMLSTNSSLTELDMRASLDTPAESIKSILETLYCHPSLEHLSVGWNKIDNNVAKYLGEMLKHNTTLRKLNCDHIRVSPTGLKLIFYGLKENHTVEVLVVGVDFSESNADASHTYDDAIDALATAIAENDNSPLKELSLSYTGMSDVGLRSLVNALRQNKTIKKLVLTRNDKITVDGLKLLKDLLKENQTIEQLDLDEEVDSDAGESDQDFADIFAALGFNDKNKVTEIADRSEARIQAGRKPRKDQVLAIRALLEGRKK